MELDKPIIILPKNRKKPEKTVKDIFPGKRKIEKKRKGVDLFHDEIMNLVGLLDEEYKKFIDEKKKKKKEKKKINNESNDNEEINENEDSTTENGEDEDEMGEDERKELKNEFIFELNRNGTYYTFKEKLKESVTKVIQENFSKENNMNNGNTKNNEEEQEKKKNGSNKNEADKIGADTVLFNEIYIFLVKKMAVVINDMFFSNAGKKIETATEKENKEKEEISKKIKKLKNYSEEALHILEDYELTEKCLEERVATNPENLNLWFDLGKFLLKNRKQYKKAEKCFVKILQEIQESEMTGELGLKTMLSYSILLLSINKIKEAEVFIQSLIDILSPGGDVEQSEFEMIYYRYAWILLNLFYVMKGDDSVNEHQTKLMCLKLCGNDEMRVVNLKCDLLLEEFNCTNICKIFFDEIKTQLEKKEGEEKKRDSIRFAIINAKIKFLDGEHKECVEELLDLIEKNGFLYKSSNLWKVIGKSHKGLEEIKKAKESFERGYSFLSEDEEEEEENNLFFCSELGWIYLDEKRYPEAKKMFLEAIEINKNYESLWLGLGISLYRLENFIESEQVFNEANLQNNSDPKVWGYLSLISLRSERWDDADLCLRESKRNGLNDTNLLNEIKEFYVEKKKEKRYEKIFAS